jgi:hypothetical protein
MTLIVGFNLGGFVMLGADTRLSSYPNEQLVYRDDTKKIENVECGLIAGAGLASLIDAVKTRIDDEELNHTDRIIDYMKGEVSYARQQPWSVHPRVRDAIDHTGWMFSYVTMSDPNDPATAAMRLAVLGASQEQLGLVGVNDVWLLPPTGTTEEQFWEWKRFAKNAIRPLSGAVEADAFGEHIRHHAECIDTLIHMVSDVNEGVAPTYQLGLHLMNPPFRAISNIINDTGTIEWTWDKSA